MECKIFLWKKVNHEFKDYIASIENYPQEGITFRDISPLMADGNAYSYAIREIVQYATDKKIDMIVGPWSAWVHRWMSSRFWIGNWICTCS